MKRKWRFKEKRRSDGSDNVDQWRIQLFGTILLFSAIGLVRLDTEDVKRRRSVRLGEPLLRHCGAPWHTSMGRNVTVHFSVTYSSPLDVLSLPPFFSSLLSSPFNSDGQPNESNAIAYTRRGHLPLYKYFYQFCQRTRCRLITRSVMKASCSRAEVLSCSLCPFFTPVKTLLWAKSSCHVLFSYIENAAPMFSINGRVTYSAIFFLSSNFFAIVIRVQQQF